MSPICARKSRRIRQPAVHSDRARRGLSLCGFQENSEIALTLLGSIPRSAILRPSTNTTDGCFRQLPGTYWSTSGV
jgi:hypothetical protein